MIELRTTGDYITVFLLAAIAGLIGGLAAELLLNRNGDTGTFELPSRKGAFFDLGGFAGLLVGAVTGIAILIVFPPETSITTTEASGLTTTIRSYDTVRLVATALIAGSAGGSVLTALQARVTAATKERDLQWQQQTGVAQLEAFAERAKEEIARVSAAATGAAPAAEVRARGGVLSDAGGPGGAETGSPNTAAAVATSDAMGNIDRALGTARAAIQRTPDRP